MHVRPELGAAPRQGGDIRQPPLPSLPGIHPHPRGRTAFQQVSAQLPGIQPVGQLQHHLPVPAVPPPEQPQRQHEIHHQPRRQQPSPLLPRPRRLHRLVHQLRRENPGQDTDRDPVRQPPIRRQPLRTIMSHKTVTISHQALKQRHLAPWAVTGSLAEMTTDAISELPPVNRLHVGVRLLSGWRKIAIHSSATLCLSSRTICSGSSGMPLRSPFKTSGRSWRRVSFTC